MQRLDIAEVARLGRDNEQASNSQGVKLDPGPSEDEKPKLDKSSNQTAGMAFLCCIDDLWSILVTKLCMSACCLLFAAQCACMTAATATIMDNGLCHFASPE